MGALSNSTAVYLSTAKEAAIHGVDEKILEFTYSKLG